MPLRPSRRLSPLAFVLAAFVLASTSPPHAQGQKKKAPAAPPAAGPALTFPTNLGVRAGTTTELELTGTKLADATGVWVMEPLKARLPTDRKNGTDPAKVRVTIEAPPHTPSGLYPIRLATRAGVSDLRTLVVDELPEVRKADGNQTKEKAQAVPASCVVLGRADAEAADFYRVAVKAGRRLTFEVLGRRLGSPIDPLVVLHDGKTRLEMIDLYADDTPGLQSDARLTHAFPADGEVLVEVRDTTYRGGPDFFYRLRIGEFPGATTAFPLAVRRGDGAAVGFSGPGADAIPAVSLATPREGCAAAVSVAPKLATGVGGWPVPVRVSDHPESVEREPNNDAATANPLPVPGGVSARFGAAHDLDFFRIAGRKGQKLEVAAAAFEVNAPTEILLRLLDAKGAEQARSDPAQAAARLAFTPPADGDYFIACEHLNYLSGPNEVYHLTVTPAAADFDLSLPQDRAEAPAGGGTAVAVTAIRSNGFAGPIELSVVGDPCLSGTVTVPPGAATAYVPLVVKAGTKAGLYPFRVRGRAADGDRTIMKCATTAEAVKAAFPNLPNAPLEFSGMAVVSVIEKPPFTLEVTAPAAVEKGKGGRLVIAVGRNGFDGEIAIAVASSAPDVTVTPKPVLKGQSGAEAAVAVGAGAAAGPAQVVLKASAKVDGREFVLTAMPATVQVAEGKAPAAKKDGAKAKEKK